MFKINFSFSVKCTRGEVKSPLFGNFLPWQNCDYEKDLTLS